MVGSVELCLGGKKFYFLGDEKVKNCPVKPEALHAGLLFNDRTRLLSAPAFLTSVYSHDT